VLKFLATAVLQKKERKVIQIREKIPAIPVCK
jgi:hypothetical protein